MKVLKETNENRNSQRGFQNTSMFILYAPAITNHCIRFINRYDKPALRGLYFFIRTRLKHYLNNMSRFQNIRIETFYVFYN